MIAIVLLLPVEEVHWTQLEHLAAAICHVRDQFLERSEESTVPNWPLPVTYTAAPPGALAPEMPAI